MCLRNNQQQHRATSRPVIRSALSGMTGFDHFHLGKTARRISEKVPQLSTVLAGVIWGKKVDFSWILWFFSELRKPLFWKTALPFSLQLDSLLCKKGRWIQKSYSHCLKIKSTSVISRKFSKILGPSKKAASWKTQNRKSYWFSSKKMSAFDNYHFCKLFSNLEIKYSCSLGTNLDDTVSFYLFLPVFP